MRTLLLVTGFFFLASCSDRGGNTQLSGGDSLVINFNTPNTNNIEKTLSTTERNAIKKLSRFVSGKTTASLSCGYDGNLLFYKQGTLLGDVSFNYSDTDCRHFIMSAGDKLSPTTMSNEAAAFLKSLSEGRSWY